MHPFRQFITQYVVLSEIEWNAIADCLTEREVPKDTVLLQEGAICRHLWFVESGLLRFYIMKDGNEVSKFFTEAPYVFTSQQSFRLRTASKENIATMEKSILWQMSAEDAFRLLEWNGWATFIRLLVQEVQAFTEEILESLQTETAENRYRWMLLHQPELLQRIPLRHLASYLGIAPQSLSRIRKNINTPRRS